MDRAGAQDDLAALDPRPSVARADSHSGGAVAGEFDAVDQRVADDAQVRAPTRGFQVAVVGRDASVVAAVHRVRRHAGAGGSVVVLAPSVVEVEADVAQRAIGPTPLILWRAPYRNRSAAAVISAIAEIEIVFELFEVGEDICARPSDASLARPFIEVGEHPANRDLAVDRGAATGAASAPIRHRCLHVGAARLQRAPLVLLHIFRAEKDRSRIGDPHRLGRLGGAIVRPGLEQ